MGAYVVTAPLAIVRGAGGELMHLYDGQAVPDNADPHDVGRLAEAGAVAASKETVAAAAQVDKPARSASHDAWMAYALSSGQWTATDLDALTRDEIRDLCA